MRIFRGLKVIDPWKFWLTLSIKMKSWVLFAVLIVVMINTIMVI